MPDDAPMPSPRRRPPRFKAADVLIDERVPDAQGRKRRPRVIKYGNVTLYHDGYTAEQIARGAEEGARVMRGIAEALKALPGIKMVEEPNIPTTNRTRRGTVCCCADGTAWKRRLTSSTESSKSFRE